SIPPEVVDDSESPDLAPADVEPDQSTCTAVFGETIEASGQICECSVYDLIGPCGAGECGTDPWFETCPIEATYVYVRSGAQSGDGSRNSPFGTIEEAVAVAPSSGHYVVVLSNVGEFEVWETLSLSADVEWWFTGGQVNGVRAWARPESPDSVNPSRVEAQVGANPLFEVAPNARAHFAFLDLRAADGDDGGSSQSGETSVVIAAHSAELVSMWQVSLRAGAGGDGGDGDQGESGSDRAENNQPEEQGCLQVPAKGPREGCPGVAPDELEPTPGGDGGPPVICAGIEYPNSRGGDGGDGGQDGQPGTGGAGGSGGLRDLNATGHTSDMDGTDGQDRGQGRHGVGGGALGYLRNGLWHPAAGERGLPGNAGGGGGGGAGGRHDHDGTNFNGASGGGGGTGGCPGGGGFGGGGGGGSIGAILFGVNAVYLRSVSIETSNGGTGGTGGTGGQGQNGAPGGSAGHSGGWSYAGAGGDGGRGGEGGDGGGGAGGASVGLVIGGTSGESSWTDFAAFRDVNFAIGNPGTGGEGEGTCEGGVWEDYDPCPVDGATGYTGEVLVIPAA
ncbi:MAG: hypothetical protein KC561_16830, partial [Myxococcales bacterium]|nr:hypothetical protein [Myxococcales bacterium]